MILCIYVEIINYIYDKVLSFKLNFKIKLFYVIIGKWIDDLNLKGIIKYEIELVEEIELFDKVFFKVFGVRDLFIVYRKIKEFVSIIINFNNRIIMLEINGIF